MIRIRKILHSVIIIHIVVFIVRIDIIHFTFLQPYFLFHKHSETPDIHVLERLEADAEFLVSVVGGNAVDAREETAVHVEVLLVGLVFQHHSGGRDVQVRRV